MVKQDLLIIGNGFDLSCKLATSYKEFFKQRFNQATEDFFDDLKIKFEANIVVYAQKVDDESKYSKVGDPVYLLGEEQRDIFLKKYENIDTKNINMWDLVIYYGRKTIPDRWSDVEARIAEFLIYKTKENHESSNYNIANYFELKQKTFNPVLAKKNGSYFYSKLILYAAGILGIKSPLESEEVLLTELNRFEKEFQKYVFNLIETDDTKTDGGYYKIAEGLLRKLLNIENVESMEHHILSFNYTTPFFKKSEEIRNLRSLNVHGRLDDENIIFGIDQENINSHEISYPFTKTYRQLIQSNNEFGKSKTILPSKNKIEKIIFYGHSLSNADKSYFQSIFDYYQIYNSNVTLIFYFNDYLKDNKRTVQKEQVSLVTRLLKNYGMTIGNDYQGDNLMHKLLLENRLFISEIKIDDIFSF